MPSKKLSCKLNNLYKQSARGKSLWDNDEYARLGNCCGITELDFRPLCESFVDEADMNRKPPSEKWVREHAAAVIKNTGRNDERLLIVGVPVQVGSNSQYDIQFYTLLRKVLLRFGFQETAPYKNKNSGNTIVAMVGQR